MIFRRPERRASFAPDGMGKSDLVAGEQMFAGLNAFEPGQQHEPHTHCDRDKVYVVLQGSGEVTIEGRTETVVPGDVAFARAGAVHGLLNPGPDRLVVLVLIAPPPNRPHCT